MEAKAKDIMTTELIFAHPNTTLEEAIKMLVNNKITGLPVIDDNRKLIGIVSEYDIIKTIDSLGTSTTLNLTHIQYTKKVISVADDTPLGEILKVFLEKRIRRLPVLSHAQELIGIVTRRDVMRVLFYRSKFL